MKTDRAFVYVLKLQGSPANWYVGSTTNIEARICEHWAGQGAQWTQMHPPVGVAEVIECLTGDPLPLERAKTAEMAMKYGWTRVRGAGYVKVDATQPVWFDSDGKKRNHAKTKQTAIQSGPLDSIIIGGEEAGVLCRNQGHEHEPQDITEMATAVVALDTRGIWED